MTPCDARDAPGRRRVPHADRATTRPAASTATCRRSILAEPVERKFLKALKNSDIEALDFASQLDEGVREGWITADERKQLEELRAMTLDAITVDDFDAHELRSASLLRQAQAHGVARAA